MKKVAKWYSHRLDRHMPLVRWGTFGRPVLLFPTAGGDAEEVERFGLIGALAPLLLAGRVKIYSTDSVAGRAWLEKEHSPRHCSWLQSQFDGFMVNELVPAIRADCNSQDIEIIAAGASIGAFNALASLCRHPDVFRGAICMSGTYDLEHWLHGQHNQDFYFSSPLHFVPNLDGPALWQLRRRFALLAFGGGRYESPDESWRVAGVLGGKGVPNRVDAWGPEWDHDWITWRRMLPEYLDEFTR